MPPVGASLRSLWPRMFADAELRAAAYALEASLQEITFIVGPLLVALLTGRRLAGARARRRGRGGRRRHAFVALAEPVRAWRPEDDRHASILGALASRGVVTLRRRSPPASASASAAPRSGFPAFAEQHGGAELGSIPLVALRRPAASSAGSWPARG